MSKKTELIFRPTSLKIDPSIKFKLQAKRLIPAQSVKYLQILLDEHLQWAKQLSNVKIKLNRAIGILSKLRHNSNSEILKITSFTLWFTFAICMSALGSKESNITKPNPNTSK